jgi:hypothetical protein
VETVDFLMLGSSWLNGSVFFCFFGQKMDGHLDDMSISLGRAGRGR